MEELVTGDDMKELCNFSLRVKVVDTQERNIALVLSSFMTRADEHFAD